MLTRSSAGLAARGSLFTVLTAAIATAQGPNLIQNGDFETGSLAPWTAAPGTANVVPYGTAGLPSSQVATTIGGGGLMLHGNTSTTVTQTVSILGAPAGSSLVFEGYVGGGVADDAGLAIQFLDANGVPRGFAAQPLVTFAERNYEQVLVRRRLAATVPPGATSAVLQIIFRDNNSQGAFPAADNFTAFLVNGSTIPAPVPLNTELLENPGFESGWIGGSPQNLTSLQTWRGAAASQNQVRPYSNSSTTTPSGAVSCAIDGAAPNPSCGAGSAGNFVFATTGSSDLFQIIDLRGNTPSFAAQNIALVASAYLGGIGIEPDEARVEVQFLDASQSARRTLQVGPVTRENRNLEPVMVRREDVLIVPTGTEAIAVHLIMTDAASGGRLATADNISVRLVALTPMPPVPLNVNLISNGDFEASSLAGSPLVLTDNRCWVGQVGGRCSTTAYGSANRPSSTFATQHQLGSQLLIDGGATRLRQTIDLSGSLPLVTSGRMAMQLSAWLGGVGAEGDQATVRVTFINSNQQNVGTPQQVGPVTAADRQNQTTLLGRVSAPFQVPQTASRVILDLEFSDIGSGGSFALADDIRLVAFDTAVQATASPFPGTPGDDLVLLTGINELPRTGIGHYVKDATAGDILRVQIISPNGSLDGMPLVLGANIYTPGNAPTPFPIYPDLALDPTSPLFFMLLGSLQFGPLSPVVIPAAQGGTNWGIQIPPILTGYNLLLQAVAFPISPTGNPKFFTSQGHEIR